MKNFAICNGKQTTVPGTFCGGQQTTVPGTFHGGEQTTVPGTFHRDQNKDCLPDCPWKAEGCRGTLKECIANLNAAQDKK